MHRHVLAAAVALLLGLVPLEAADLVNASFEEQGEHSDLAAGWSRWGDWINREAGWEPVHDGACIMGYHHWQIEGSGNSGLWQDVEVEAGKGYTFSIFANVDPAEDDKVGPESVEVRLETTLYGEQSTVQSRTYPVKDLARDGSWSLLEVSATAPTDLLRVLVVMTPGKDNKPRGGALKFDDARLAAREP